MACWNMLNIMTRDADVFCWLIAKPSLMSGQAALFVPVGCSQGYLHQWGTWSTSGYHCPEQKNAAEKISTKIMEGRTLNIDHIDLFILWFQYKCKVVYSLTIRCRTLALCVLWVLWVQVCNNNRDWFPLVSKFLRKQQLSWCWRWWLQRKCPVCLRKRPREGIAWKRGTSFKHLTRQQTV